MIIIIIKNRGSLVWYIVAGGVHTFWRASVEDVAAALLLLCMYVCMYTYICIYVYMYI